MAISVLPLNKLLKSGQEEGDINSLLFSFVGLRNNSASYDIEDFLRNKSIQFEKMDLARTYLVLADYKKETYLAGYFSIANKPLVVKRKAFKRLSKSLQKKLMGFGHKTDVQNYECKGYLIGQLGKNYSEEAKKANQVSGEDLLQLSYEKILEAHEVVGGRVVHLECQNIDSLKDFYFRNGFREIEDFESPNQMHVFVKSIDNL